MAFQNISVIDALQEHLAVCSELFGLAQMEADALRNPAPFPAAAIQEQRKRLLARLDASSRIVSLERQRWEHQRTVASEASPELANLVQRVLDATMRVLVLDRENEQNLLRRGLLPTAALPRAEQAQPNFVTRLYQRHGQT